MAGGQRDQVRVMAKGAGRAGARMSVTVADLSVDALKANGSLINGFGDSSQALRKAL